MPLPLYLLRICRGCGGQSQLPMASVLTSLRQAGQFRREAKPDLEIVLAILNGGEFSGELACAKCQGTRAHWQEARDDPDWNDLPGSTRPCGNCGSPIEAERLEVFPDADQCAACATGKKPAKPDRQVDDFCPDCGGLLTTKMERQRVTRYVVCCTDCNWKRR